MIQYVAQRMMEMDAESLCAAAYGERSAERLNSRNGYRERLWETRAGSVDLKIPKLRKGSYFPGILEPRRPAEKALAAVIQEAYVQGVSTRSVDEPVKAMGMSGISKSQVSRLCAEIDERVNAFLTRPIEGHVGECPADSVVRQRLRVAAIDRGAELACTKHLRARYQLQRHSFGSKPSRTLLDEGCRATFNIADTMKRRRMIGHARSCGLRRLAWHWPDPRRLCL